MARNKFDADEEIEQKFNPHIIMRLAKWMKPFTGWMVLSCIIMLVSSAISLTSPYLTRMAIDKAIPNADYRMLVIISAALLLSTLVVRILLAQKLRIMKRVAQKIIVNIRRDVFIKLQSLPFSYFDSRPHGKILIRVVNYVNSLSDLLSNGIIQLISDLFNIIVIIGFMLAIDPRLTLVSLSVLPVLFAVLLLLKKSQHEA